LIYNISHQVRFPLLAFELERKAVLMDSQRNTTSPKDPDLAGSPRRDSVALIGAGAIGTVVADAVAEKSDVTILRRATSRAMSIDRGDGPVPLRARVEQSPDGLGVMDWIILATKAHQISSAAASIAALTGPRTRIAVLQNGIGHSDRVAEWVPEQRVVPAVVFISAERTGPDVVRLRQLDKLVLPRTEVAREFRALFADDFPVQLDPEFDLFAWRKLIMNAALNSITALTGRAAGVARAPGGRELLSTILQEGIEVARARGVPMANDEFAIMRDKIENLPPSAPTSMQLDRAHGRPLEYQFLTGAVLKEAATAGVSAPATSALHHLMAALEADGPAPRTM
jgi:2-dehydropantoate 2-reductase